MTALRLALAVALAALAAGARAQTMLDQEERLIDIHSLLLDLPPLVAPGALAPGRIAVGLEAVTIPEIDGTTGGRTQITASDRTPVFPRPRVAVGLPAPAGFRAFAGAAYIPPFRINEVSTHYGAIEAGLAWVPEPFRAGVRGHALYAVSESPVTEPGTRDTLRTSAWGLDASAGWRLDLPRRLALEPYVGGGVVGLRGRFEVTSDGNVLRSRHTGAAWFGGARLSLDDGWEAVTEVSAYPGRLVHTNLRLGYVFR